jgi:UV DNA damage endonuclease
MSLKLGYACINTTLPTRFRTCRLKTVEKEGLSKVKELALHNLNEVLRAIKWNAENGILMYRITSELIPFASHVITNEWEWWKDSDVVEKAWEIKVERQTHKMRFSCHPGQFTLLNSPNQEIVERSLLDLIYHDKLMDLLEGTDMILHVGGAYGDKGKAKERFINQYNLLPNGIKQKLRLENDHNTFTIEDVVQIYEKCGVPICFDIHHSNCNPPSEPVSTYIPHVFASWNGFGRPKTHISSGRTGKTDPAHHDYILKKDFIAFCKLLNTNKVDIIFEAKQKEKSVLRIIDWIKSEGKTKFLIET